MCVSLGSLYMCNACVLRVYMCVCVHVLQITTVSLSVKLSFLYFSFCSPFHSPLPSLSLPLYIRVFRNNLSRIHLNSISRALANRISRGDRVSPKKKKKKDRYRKSNEKKMMKEEKNEKSRSPTTDKYIFTAIIYTHTCRSSHPCRYFAFFLPSAPLPTPSRSRRSFLPLRFSYFPSLSSRTSILIETLSIPLACYQFLQLALRSVLPLPTLFVRFLKSTLKFT